MSEQTNISAPRNSMLAVVGGSEARVIGLRSETC